VLPNNNDGSSGQIIAAHQAMDVDLIERRPEVEGMAGKWRLVVQQQIWGVMKE
jgi:hypothetical protein